MGVKESVNSEKLVKLYGVTTAMPNGNERVETVHLVYKYIFCLQSFQDIRIKLYSLLRRLGGTKKDIRAAYRSIIYNINGHHDSKTYKLKIYNYYYFNTVLVATVLSD